MNIFASNQCPVQSAKDLPSILVNKMAVESLQILSTAHFVLDGKQVAYKPTHQNHPSCVWSRANKANYAWAFEHFKALCKEYTFRTGKIHACEAHLKAVESAPVGCPDGELEMFALCMPDEHKAKGIFDPTAAYRSYLNAKFTEWLARDKPVKVEWKNRKQPTWVNI